MRDRTGVLLIAAAVLALDQITKLMVSARIPFQVRIDLIDNFLALTHVRNTGAAFGLLGDAPVAPVRAGLVVVSVLAIGLIWAYARQGWHEPRVMATFGLILVVRWATSSIGCVSTMSSTSSTSTGAVTIGHPLTSPIWRLPLARYPCSSSWLNKARSKKIHP